jgi:hypothetical protein
MQISGVSIALTWPRRLCLLRVLLCAIATATSFPLSKHTGGGDTAPAFSGLRVCLQLMLELGLPPFMWSFPPSATLTSLPAPGCWARAPAPALSGLARLVYLQFCEGFPYPSLQCSGHPTLFATSLLVLFLITQFLFFSLGGGVSLSRGLCRSGPGLPVGVLRTT